MNLLAVDTSTEACSVALSVEDNLFHRFQIVPQKHTQLILLMIEQVLAAAKIEIDQLDVLAFGAGNPNSV